MPLCPCHTRFTTFAIYLEIIVSMCTNERNAVDCCWLVAGGGGGAAAAVVVNRRNWGGDRGDAERGYGRHGMHGKSTIPSITRDSQTIY